MEEAVLLTATLATVLAWAVTHQTNADAKAETPVLWPPHAKSWLVGKDFDAGRDWGQEEKGTTEDEMAGLASLTRWTWVWVYSGSWWWTGRPGVLRFMGLQGIGHDWATELNWTEKLKIELPYDPAIPLMGIYLKKMKTQIQKDICTPVFIATLFKIWKQPNEWIKIWNGNIAHP